MKKVLFTIYSIIALTLTYGQEIKTEKESFKIIAAGKVKSTSDPMITLAKDHVIISVPNKLDIEADSALIDRNKNLLTTYGTKSFTFNGKVMVDKKNNRICKFRLGENILLVE